MWLTTFQWEMIAAAEKISFVVILTWLQVARFYRVLFLCNYMYGNSQKFPSRCEELSITVKLFLITDGELIMVVSIRVKLCRTTTYIHTYEVHKISLQTFFVLALLLIVHTWNSRPLQSNLLRRQCTCCTIPTTFGTSHGSPQWSSSQPLSSPQLSHKKASELRE